MRELLRRRVILVLAAVAAVGTGGGVAYALPRSPDRSEAISQFARVSPIPSATVAASATASETATPLAVAASGLTPPPAESSAVPAAPVASSSPEGCPTGEFQQEVEAALVTLGGFGATAVDGQQSAMDCAAIKAFQSRFGISPANGRAGEVTVGVARRMVASVAPQELAKCEPEGAGVIVCVDLTQQTVWAVRDHTVVFGPTVTRTGMPGYATPVGTYHVYDRSTRGWSKPYQVWLPYWQNFNGGIGLHETTTYLHAMANGSHGCVNLLHGDASTLYEMTALGTTVRVFGHRSGT